MMKYPLPNLSVALLTGVFFVNVVASNHAQASSVYDYGETNLKSLRQAYKQGNLHILQIGDSHTAGDHFTEQLRKRLQADIGDGGLGFAYPDKLKGQRNARHGYHSSWSLNNSRNNKWGANYPLGGVYAVSNSRYNTLNLTSEYYLGDTQYADIVVYGDKGQNLTLNNKNGSSSLTLKKSGWQVVPAKINFPTAIQADSGIRVGGFWLKHRQGGIVSAMGINGSTQDYWNRWHSNLVQGLSFSQADLVILAYGTNEAFRSSASDLTHDMTRAIKKIRRGLPNASILIVGAPESLKSTKGRCGTRSPSLDSVQYQLQQIASKNHTLYWDWQDSMGGKCSMKSWVDQGLAASDGVHFSRAGYGRVANDLYNNLKSVLNNTQVKSTQMKASDTHSKKPITRTYQSGSDTTEISNVLNTTYHSEGVNKIYQEEEQPKRTSSNGSSGGKICNTKGECYYF